MHKSTLYFSDLTANVAAALAEDIRSGDINQWVYCLVTLRIFLLHLFEDLHRLIIVLFIKEFLTCRVEIIGVYLT